MSSNPAVAILDVFLECHPDVQNIACHTVTYGNVVCTRFLPLARARSVAAGDSSLSVLHPLNRFYESSGTSFPQMELMTLEDDTWVPDWSTLRPGADSTQASVQCWVEDPTPAQVIKRLLDPRHILNSAVSAAGDAGLELQVGFEVEFVFLDSDGNVLPMPGQPLCLISSTASRSPFRTVVFEAVKHLEFAGIGIWGFHTENAGWEISSAPTSPMEAVDNLVMIHETLKEVAYQHGLRVSFYPTHGNEHTIGQHLHLSINGESVTTAKADQWLAGMLQHMPATAAFLNGGVDSYDPHRRFWCGSGTASWSRGKCGAIRRFGDAHWEVRLGDTMCNPYLQLAALLHAGLDGVQRQTPLEIKSLDIVGFVEEVPAETLQQVGIKDNLPASLEEALALLEKDHKGEGGLSELMGKEVVEAYLVAKRYELEVQSKLDPQTRRKAVVQNI